MKKLRILLKILCVLVTLFSVGMLQVTNGAAAEVAKAGINTVENDLYSTPPIHVQRKLLDYDEIDPNEVKSLHISTPKPKIRLIDRKKPKYNAFSQRIPVYGEENGQVCDYVVQCTKKDKRVENEKSDDSKVTDAVDKHNPSHRVRAEQFIGESTHTISTGSRSIGTDATALVLTAAVVQVLINK